MFPLDEQFIVRRDNVPPTVYYVPDYITEDEESFLIRSVLNSPKPKWTYLSNRRLQNWGGLPLKKGMIREPLPGWLRIYCDKLAREEVFEKNVPNHVLVNEYLAGQGIMPHEDGPLFYPTVATINLQSHTVLNFYEKRSELLVTPDYLPKTVGDDRLENYSRKGDECVFKLLVKPRSLLILKNDVYKNYLHGIEEITEDHIDRSVVNLHRDVQVGDTLQRATRISLTIRFVPKVLTSIALFK